MRSRSSNLLRLFAAATIVASSLALIPAQPAHAAGSPNITLAKEMPAKALAGDPAIPVRLTATNPDTVDGYNLSFKDVLPPGVTLVTADPAPTTILDDAPIANFTTVLWENLADLPPDSTFSVSYSYTHDGSYDVGDTITNAAAAFVNSNPRFIPKFSATGVPSDFTGNDSATQDTLLVPFLLEKSEPSEEEELLRGLHDHQTAYTLEISNNFIANSDSFQIDDWIPAGMEYLICGADDYSAADEYTGSGAINAAGNAPTLTNPCIRPTTVDTVTLDPDGAGPLPPALYTHVLWDAANLGLTLTPGQVWRMDYVAAIPMNANAPFITPPSAASLQQAANVDNNTGSSTEETSTEQGMQNYALLTGDYTGDSQEYTDDAYEAVSAEDLSIHKGVDNGVIGQGNLDRWTLLIESSEYVTSASNIVVTDTVPDGLCPLGTGTTEGTAECDFAGEPEPTHPYSLAQENSNGTWTLRWDFDSIGALGALGRSESRTIAFDTKVREYYQESGSNATPVVAEDEWTNKVALTATVDGRSVEDESDASQSAPSVSILKEVADQPLVSGPSPFACGNGSGLSWDDSVGSDYGPGDRACWRLTVTFPANLDTAGATITDFIPVGHAYTGSDSWASGENTTAGIIVTPDLTASAGGILRWTIGDGGGFTDIGQIVEIVFSTSLSAPADAADGDLLQNLMKFSHSNSAGSVFPLRDQADALWAEPEVDLVKGVYEVVRGATTVEGPHDADDNVDGVPVIEDDRVTFRLTIDNNGSRAANDVEVIDTLPPGITCGDVVVASITAPGVCAGDRIEWLGATSIDIAAGGTATLDYDIDVPSGVSPGLNLVNTAGVRSYLSPTNLNTDFVYVPADNIDPDVATNIGTDENTTAADDTSSIYTESVGLTKIRTTEIAEAGNDATTEATIGEEITYTITAVVPEGLSVYGPAVLSDSLSSELELVSAQIISWDGVPADEPALVVDLGADTVTATYVDPHNNPIGGPAPGDDTLVVEVVARVADVASNVAGTAVSNSASFDYETQDSTPRQETTSVATDVVEPNIGISKDENDPDDNVQPGQSFTYALTVSNAAGESVAHDIVITDQVPEGLAPTTISDGGIYVADGIPGNGVAGTITWTVASIDPGNSVLRTYDVTVDDPVVGSSVLVNTANVIASSIAGATVDERDAASPHAGTPPSRYEETTTDTVFAPSLQIGKAVTGSPVTIGEPVQYTVTVTIPAQVIMYDATVIDTVPSGISFDGTVSMTCLDGSANPCVPNIAPVQIGTDSAWYLGDLNPSSSEPRIVTIVYNGHVLNTVNGGDTETNSAAVFGNTIDRILIEPPLTTPAPSSFDVTAGPATADVAIIEPNLTINKNVVGQVGDTDTRRALPNETLTFELTIANTGDSPAHDVVITDAVDNRVVQNLIAAGTDNGISWIVTDADPSDGDLGWFVAGPIPAGESFTITYDVDVWDANSGHEVIVGPEFSNVADIASYYGVVEAVRTVNPTVTYREYTDVDEDQVDIELDLASIGDRVWFDRNGDGIQDGDEPGLENIAVTVTYLGPDNTLGTGDDETFNTTTGTNGQYLIEDLPGGQYQVDITTGDLPAGMAASYDLDDGNVGPDDQWIGTLGQNEDKRDVDFGYNGSGLIGDTIWFDRNGDGSLDAGEHGLEGVTVTVTWSGPDGDVAFIATTDANGNYEVAGLPPGNYTIVVDDTTLPSGMDPTFDDDGVGTPHTSTVVLGNGEEYRDSDFGYNGASEIGDFIWLDLDGDGSLGAGEKGIPGVVVQLTWPGEDGILGNGDDDVFLATTDANGSYLFDGLPAGDYQVDVLGGLPAFVANTFDEDLNGDSSVTVTLGASDSHLSTDFGYQGTTSIGDFVWFDIDNNGAFDGGEPGIGGVEVTLTYAGPDGIIGNADDILLVTTTDADGAYLFAGLPEGDYIVAVTDGLPAGLTNTYDEDADLDGDSGEFTVLNNTMHLTADFGYTGTGSLGDYIWLDRNGDGVQDGDEPGIPGVTINATWDGPDGIAGTGDDVTFTTVTDIDGGYTIDNLPAGDYTVDVDAGTLPAGVAPTADRDATADNTTTLTLGDGEDISDVDFGYRGGGSIGDTVWFDRNGDGTEDPDEYGLSGIKVDLVWAGPDGIIGNADDESFTTLTDVDGNYAFDNLPEGDYQVSVDTGTLPAGMAATFDEDDGLDSTIAVNLSDGESHQTADFGYNGSGSIGDRVWIDRNGDGSQDADEPGVPGQEVTLKWGGPDGVLGGVDDQVYTTTTSAGGIYSFPGLPPGEYTVEVTGDIVAAATNTSDEDADNDSETPVTLGDGEDHLTADFGYQGSAAIGDTVWLDLNADGIEDAGEPGIAGVDVVITWYGSDGVSGGGDDVVYPAATTDANGFYQMTNLPSGEYGVEVVSGVPLGLSNSGDEDGDLDGQTDVSGLGVGEVYETADFGYAGSGVIGDTIWLDLDGDGVQSVDEPGIPEVDVTLTWAGADGILGNGDDVAITTTTDSAGMYIFENLPAGDFTVTVDSADLPSGIVPTADPDGGSDDTSAVTLAAGGADLDQDFGYQGEASIGDLVWHDLNGNGVADPGEPGVPGVTVTITYHGPDGTAGTDDDIEVVTTTDPDGGYTASGLPGGGYTVTIDPASLPAGTEPGDDLDGGDPASTSVTIGDTEDKDDVDYPIVGHSGLQGVVETHECTIDGFPLVGVAGAVIRVTWDGPSGPASVEVTTDVDGTWMAPNLPPGDYVVTLVATSLPPGTVPTSPSAVNVVLAAGATEAVGHTVDQPIDLISRVWIDENGNGTIDPGEPGVAGVIVTLRDEDGLALATATTDTNGNYEFGGLVPGNYTVEIDPATIPSDLVLTIDPDGGSDLIAAAIISPCQGAISVDFGFRDEADLPLTGLDLTNALRMSFAMLLLGAALLFVGERRRRIEG